MGIPAYLAVLAIVAEFSGSLGLLGLLVAHPHSGVWVLVFPGKIGINEDQLSLCCDLVEEIFNVLIGNTPT
jgi:hypothetical protein